MIKDEEKTDTAQIQVAPVANETNGQEKVALEVEAGKVSEVKKANSVFKNLYWVSCAIGAGICMGSGSFIYANNFAQYGLLGNGALGPGAWVIFVIIKLTAEVRYRLKHGRWTKAKGSAWFTDDGKFKPKTLIPLTSHTLTNLGYTICLTFCWTWAKRAGMNQGIISTLLSFATIFNLCVFRLYFKEKLTWHQGVGICVMIVAVFCLAADPSGAPTGDESLTVEERRALGYKALGLGLVAPVLITTKHFFARLFKKDYDAMWQVIDGLCVEYIAFSVFFYYLAQKPDYELTWSNFFLGTFASVLMSMGRILINMAIVAGIAAASQSLMSTHAVWQTFWGALLAGQAITYLQGLGIALAILAVSTIGLLKMVLEKL